MRSRGRWQAGIWECEHTAYPRLVTGSRVLIMSGWEKIPGGAVMQKVENPYPTLTPALHRAVVRTVVQSITLGYLSISK